MGQVPRTLVFAGTAWRRLTLSSLSRVSHIPHPEELGSVRGQDPNCKRKQQKKTYLFRKK
jgi:hypothetical protein